MTWEIKPTEINGALWFKIWHHGYTDGQLHATMQRAKERVRYYERMFAQGFDCTYLGKKWGEQ